MAKGWHIEKKISVAVLVSFLAILIGLIGNICAGIWYAAKLDSRVGTLEEKTSEIRADIKEIHGYMIKSYSEVPNSEIAR